MLGMEQGMEQGKEQVARGYWVAWPCSGGPVVTYPTHGWKSKGNV